MEVAPIASSSPTADLAKFVTELTYDDMPEAVQARTRQIVLDTLASALAGHDAAEVDQVLDAASRLAPGDDASVIGGGRMSEAGATLANGYLITAVTVCDIHRPTTCHTTPEVVAPALAMAERQASSGRDLLVAVAAGLETATRVGLGLGPAGMRARGWHAPGVLGPFGGAASAGRLLGLDTRQMTYAFGFAGSQAAGTYAQLGTAAIKLQQARGALGGLLSARFAAAGLNANEEILLHPDGGLFSTYSNESNPPAVTRGLGEDWELLRISLRAWPVAVHLQPVVTGLMELLADESIRPASTSRVIVRMSPTAFRMHGEVPWSDRFRARLSAPYVTAVVLHDRACWLEQFTADRVRDRKIAEFVEHQVAIEPDARIENGTAAIELHLADGSLRHRSVSVARGEPDLPLSQGDIEAKFRAAAGPVALPVTADRLIETIVNLHELADVAGLLDMLRSDVPRARAHARVASA